MSVLTKFLELENIHLLIIGTFKGDENSMKSIRDFSFSKVENDETEENDVHRNRFYFGSSKYLVQSKN